MSFGGSFRALHLAFHILMALTLLAEEEIWLANYKYTYSNCMFKVLENYHQMRH